MPILRSPPSAPSLPLVSLSSPPATARGSAPPCPFAPSDYPIHGPRLFSPPCPKVLSTGSRAPTVHPPSPAESMSPIFTPSPCTLSRARCRHVAAADSETSPSDPKHSLDSHFTALFAPSSSASSRSRFTGFHSAGRFRPFWICPEQWARSARAHRLLLCRFSRDLSTDWSCAPRELLGSGTYRVPTLHDTIPDLSTRHRPILNLGDCTAIVSHVLQVSGYGIRSPT
ncbi:hypothetical protein MPTK2_1g08880 [Marchantia polymorpha subsp. ruderalis]